MAKMQSFINTLKSLHVNDVGWMHHTWNQLQNLKRSIGKIEVAVENFCVGVDASLGSNAERYMQPVNAAKLASEILYGVFICDALGIN